MITDAPVDYVAVTNTRQAMWSTGAVHEIARENVVMAEPLCTAAAWTAVTASLRQASPP